MDDSEHTDSPRLEQLASDPRLAARRAAALRDARRRGEQLNIDPSDVGPWASDPPPPRPPVVSRLRTRRAPRRRRTRTSRPRATARGPDDGPAPLGPPATDPVARRASVAAHQAGVR